MKSELTPKKLVYEKSKFYSFFLVGQIGKISARLAILFALSAIPFIDRAQSVVQISTG
jgi:hypothetical protein